MTGEGIIYEDKTAKWMNTKLKKNRDVINPLMFKTEVISFNMILYRVEKNANTPFWLAISYSHKQSRIW